MFYFKLNALLNHRPSDADEVNQLFKEYDEIVKVQIGMNVPAKLRRSTSKEFIEQIESRKCGIYYILYNNLYYSKRYFFARKNTFSIHQIVLRTVKTILHIF